MYIHDEFLYFLFDHDVSDKPRLCSPSLTDSIFYALHITMCVSATDYVPFVWQMAESKLWHERLRF